MTTLTFTVQYNGSADADDRAVMIAAIDEENAKRTALNNAVPPPNPLHDMLLKSTNAERKASAELIASARWTQVHLKEIRQLNETIGNDSRFKALRPYWREANEATKDAVESALGAPVQ
mgnify:CR=1 FL=1